jgi:hypothetical protein
MTEAVEIKPRFLDVQKAPSSVVEKTSFDKATIAATFYENKFFVMIIVMVIIVIAVIAYLYFSKSPNVPAQVAAQAPAPTQTPVKPPFAVSKTTLANIKSKSNAANQRGPDNDSVDTDNTGDTVDENVDSAADTEDNTDAITESGDDIPVMEESPKELVRETCEYILTSGKNCKNKATVGAFCKKHADTE